MPVVLIRKGFVYRVYPTAEQVVRLAAWDNALRFLWNIANEQRVMGLARAKGEQRFPTAFDQQLELTQLREELPWLADVPRNVCAQLLVEMDKAWQRCFKSLSGRPRWKRKGRDTLSFCEPGATKFHLDGPSAIHFPKLGSLRAVVHRPLEGKPKTCTLRRDGNQWFASIVCEIEIADPAPRVEPTVALDRGVVNLIADSDGIIIANPKHLDAARKRLARAQRTVSRRKKGSKNREKAKARVAVIHRKVRRQRDHVLHTISHDYAKSHGTVVIERLQIGNMSRSAAGTVEEPGSNVAQKRGLNRSILGAGWGKLAALLGYKLARAGGRLVEVPAAYSSQTCAKCGHVDPASRVTRALFVCTACGRREHADVNAAQVLKSRANRSAQLGEASGLPGRRTKKRLRVARRGSESSAVRLG